MSFLEEDTIYIAEEKDFTTLSVVKYFPNMVQVHGFSQPLNLIDFEVIDRGEVLEYRTENHKILFRLLTPESFAETFPEQRRTFFSTEDIQEAFLKRMERMYSVAEAQDSTYAFTLEDGEDTSRRVLELLQLTDEGTISYRENGQWHDMNEREEYPTIHDKDMFFVEPENVQDAIQMWDGSEDNEDGLSESDVTQYAAFQ